MKSVPNVDKATEVEPDHFIVVPRMTVADEWR